MPGRSRVRSNSGRGWKLIRSVYDTVHMALWSVLIAAVIFVCMFTLPNLPRLQAQAELQRAQEIAAENRYYCEKWGFPAETHRYAVCTLDLQELRAKMDLRASDSIMFP